MMNITPKEVWRPIRDYPYEVSSFGRVRRSTPENNTYVGKILKPNYYRDGYQYVILCRDGITRTFKVHRLVCEVFHGPPPFPNAQVRHLDGNVTNNVPRNVIWGTARDNARDRDGHGTTRRGESCTRAVFTQAEVDEIRCRHAEAQEGRQRVPRGFRRRLAEEYSISVNTLAHIIKHGYDYERNT